MRSLRADTTTASFHSLEDPLAEHLSEYSGHVRDSTGY
jgi:hypothetical protein